MPRKKQHDWGARLNVRIPKGLQARIRRVLKAERQRTGYKIQMVDVAHRILEAGLDVMENPK